MAFFRCEHCGHQRSVSVEYSGRIGRCPDCRQLSPILNDPTLLDRLSSAALTFSKYWGQTALLSGLTAIGLGAYFAAWNFVLGSPSRSTNQVIIPVKSHDNSLKARPATESDSRSHLQAVERPVPQIEKRDSNPPNVIPNLAEDLVVHSAQSDDTSGKVKLSTKTEVPMPPERELHVADPQPAIQESKPTTADNSPKLKSAIGKSKTKRSKSEPIDSRDQIAIGKELFEHRWEPHDRLAGGGDGLGPVFNARSCLECHFQAGSGGSGTNAHNVEAFEILPDRDGAEIQNGIVHAFTRSTSSSESRSQLLLKFGSPKVPTRGPNQNAPVMIDAIRIVFVNTPALWGNGLIDQIEDQALDRLAKDQELTGRFRRLPNGKIGKFGWKGQIDSLHEFVGSACAAELGLTNSIRSQQDPGNYRDDSRAKPDLSDSQVTSLVSYVRQLPAPQQIMPQDESSRTIVERGHHLFSTIGCANCHVQNVSMVQGVYSDFRLHEVAAIGLMGDEYYPPSPPVYTPPVYQPKLAEWKTPPLWGVADTAPYWHDGSAPTLAAAILKHSKQAQNSRDQYERMGKEKQQQLLAFLDTLKAPVLSK